jgi:hypothetical protein
VELSNVISTSHNEGRGVTPSETSAFAVSTSAILAHNEGRGVTPSETIRLLDRIVSREEVRTTKAGV